MFDISRLIQQYQQFRQNYQGNPQQQVQQMLNSGQVTQDQLNRIMPIAQQMYQMLNGRS